MLILLCMCPHTEERDRVCVFSYPHWKLLFYKFSLFCRDKKRACVYPLFLSLKRPFWWKKRYFGTLSSNSTIAFILLYMCPHTTIYACSHYCACVLVLLYVSSYYYVCVLILVYMPVSFSCLHAACRARCGKTCDKSASRYTHISIYSLILWYE